MGNKTKRERHRFVDTAYGEVMLKEFEDVCDVYIGDNHDEYAGTIECDINAEESLIADLVEEMM